MKAVPGFWVAVAAADYNEDVEVIGVHGHVTDALRRCDDVAGRDDHIFALYTVERWAVGADHADRDVQLLRDKDDREPCGCGERSGVVEWVSRQPLACRWLCRACLAAS